MQRIRRQLAQQNQWDYSHSFQKHLKSVKRPALQKSSGPLYLSYCALVDINRNKFSSF